MAIRGVNPSYFAGMPTVALDPKASKQNPQYAQMLSQAMQNQAAATDKRRESDEDNAFKARSQTETERSNRGVEDVAKRKAGVLEAEEARLKGGQDFSQDRLKSADTERLIEAAHRAKEAKDQVAYDFLNSELEKRGVNVRSKQESDEDFAARMNRAPPSPPPAAKPAAPPIDRSPMPPRSPPPTASFPPAGEAEAAPPMRAVPAGPPPPRASASFPPTNGAPPPGPTPAPRAAAPAAGAPPSPGWPAPPPPTDDSAFFQAPFDRAGLEAGLDRVAPTDQQILNAYIAESVRREKAGLPSAPPPKSLLPGKTLRTRAAESDQMLSPDDPLLKQRAQ